MSESYTIWWVDDRTERKNDQAKSLDEELDQLSVEFFLPESIIEKIDEGTEEEPDLLLVDWFLHEKSEYEGDGLSFEGRIREVFPDTPIYGFSAQYSEPGFKERRSKDRFDLLLDLNDLTGQQPGERLLRDIKDYQSLQGIRGEGLEALMDVIDVPEEDRSERFPSALPREFSDGIPGDGEYESGSVLRIARWIRNSLLRKPGLTWSQQLTATKVGLSEEAFENKYHEEFTDSIYSGPFADDVGKQWWRSRVINRLLDLSAEMDVSIGAPWLAGPQILDADEEEISECVVCEDPGPETTAYRSVDDDQLLPAHHSCSYIEKPRDGVFEDLRVISKE